jgi:NADH-quinone oxidoreductase subunit L
MQNYIWLVPFFPLLGFLIVGLGRNVLGKTSGWVASLAILASFILSVLLFAQISGEEGEGKNIAVQHLYDFISFGKINIPFTLYVDRLSALFLLIITGVGFLIHLYSIAYMKDDENVGKYFAYLNLFVFFMLLLVLGSNYIIMFIGWEGVGLASYLLIGFWYKKEAYAAAAQKAFVMNRIGDLGFLIGIFLLLAKIDTLEIAEMQGMISKGIIESPIYLASIALCFFIGATGKSAQIPLFTWLPDAMAGPTPVSALIHAATMVTAGIYMISRSHFIFTMVPNVQNVILVIGLATALVAASIATQQNDIKKVLAYSTISQLGFMFMALGVGAYVAAIFHVLTHAFFKALLFLGSGSVIHAMHHEQDIRKMGGLKKQLKITYITFFIGCIAIAGIPPLSGFFSKDEIMMHVFTHQPWGKIYWIGGMIAAMLTAYYMFRLLFLTFFGKFRGTKEQEHHLHESPALMTMPLIVLAILSIVAGFIGLPEVIGEHRLNEFLIPVLGKSLAANPETHQLSHSGEWMLMAIAVAIALIGIAIAWFGYKKYNENKVAIGFNKILEDKWYFDEAYEKIISNPMQKMSNWTNQFFEPKIIDGGVNGIGKLTQFGAKTFRLLQNGSVGFYFFLMVLGIIFIILMQTIFS